MEVLNLVLLTMNQFLQNSLKLFQKSSILSRKSLMNHPKIKFSISLHVSRNSEPCLGPSRVPDAPCTKEFRLQLLYSIGNKEWGRRKRRRKCYSWILTVGYRLCIIYFPAANVLHCTSVLPFLFHWLRQAKKRCSDGIGREPSCSCVKRVEAIT